MRRAIVVLEFILSDDVNGYDRSYACDNQDVAPMVPGLRQLFSRMQTEEFYRICVLGYLDKEWSEWFDSMTIAHESNGVTVLAGALVDQAALYGVLIRIRNLGLTLLSVNVIEKDVF